MHLEAQKALLEKKYPGSFSQFHSTRWPPQDSAEVPLPVDRTGPQTLGFLVKSWLLLLDPHTSRVHLYKLNSTKMSYLRVFDNFVAGATYLDRVLGVRPKSPPS